MAWNLPIDSKSKVCSRRSGEFNRLAQMLGSIAKHHLSECPVHRIENPMKMMISRSVVSMFGLALLATACGGGGGGGDGGGGDGCAGANTSALAGTYFVNFVKPGAGCTEFSFSPVSKDDVIVIGDAGTITNLEDIFDPKFEQVTVNSVCPDGAVRVVVVGDGYTITAVGTVTSEFGNTELDLMITDSVDGCSVEVEANLPNVLVGTWSGTFDGFFDLPQTAWTMQVETDGSILSMAIGTGTDLMNLEVSGGAIGNEVHVEGLYGDQPFIIDAEVDLYGTLGGQLSSEVTTRISIMKGELESSD